MEQNSQFVPGTDMVSLESFRTCLSISPLQQIDIIGASLA
jgi:hypothetical protein